MAGVFGSMLKSVLILSHALIIKLVSFVARYVNRWGKIIVLLFDYFTLNAWSFLLAAVSLPLALFLQTQLHYCCIPSPHLISAKTTALLLHPFPMPYFCNHKHVPGVCVWASELLPLGSAWPLYGKENLGRSWTWSFLPDATCLKTSCSLVLPLGGLAGLLLCHLQAENADHQHFCLLPHNRLLSETALVGPHGWVGNG